MTSMQILNHLPKGEAKRGFAEALAEEGARLRIPAAVLAAVLSVESAGRGFDKSGALLHRFEPHLYWPTRYSWRDSLAMKANERERLFESALNENRERALRSASFGLPQILGRNFGAAGYTSVEAMVRAFSASEAEQVRGFFHFLEHEGLDAPLRAGDYDAFALAYNGRGQPEVYSKKLQRAIKRGQGPKGFAPLSAGSKGPRVRALQAALGVTQDGHFGSETGAAVREFQEAHGLAADGVVGRLTASALFGAGEAGSLSSPTLEERFSEAITNTARPVAAAATAAALVVEASPPGSAHFFILGLIGLAGAGLVAHLISRR